jgi:uncharacterized membrane protein
MNTLSTRAAKSPNWFGIVLFSIMFWLSGSLLIDLVVMPGLFFSGMMSQPDFDTAGYTLFWAFNRIELLCAALIVSGLLMARQARSDHDVISSGIRSRWAVEIAAVLLTITLVLTYWLSPAMGALGVSLNALEGNFTIPAGMTQMHMAYWGLEVIKLLGCGFLLKLALQDLRLVDSEV